MALTNEEKITIIDQHIKSLDFTIYGGELDLIEANSVVSIDASLVSSITERVANATAKKTALQEERDLLV